MSTAINLPPPWCSTRLAPPRPGEVRKNSARQRDENKCESYLVMFFSACNYEFGKIHFIVN